MTGRLAAPAGCAALLALVVWLVALDGNWVLQKNLAFVELARSAAQPGVHSTAERRFGALAAEAPADARANAGLGLSLLLSGTAGAAVSPLQVADRLDADQVTKYWVGEALYRAGRGEEALVAWRKVTGGRPQVALHVARRLDSAGRPEAAKALLYDALERGAGTTGERASLNLEIGNINVYRWADPEETRRAAVQAMALDASSARAHTLLAWSSLQTGGYEVAAAESSAALALGDETHEPYEVRGRALLALGQADASIPALLRSIELAPHMVQTHVDLGRAYLATRRFDEARQEFRRALELEPGSEEASQGLLAAESGGR